MDSVTWINEYFKEKPAGRFLEVGAFDGQETSVTPSLTKLGWSGVLVEPSPRSFAKLLDLPSEIRNRVTLLNVALSPLGGLCWFHTNEEDQQRSSLDSYWAHYRPRNSRVESFGICSVTPREVLDWVGYNFQLITIDVEQMNREVLKAFPLETLYDTEIICVEADRSREEEQMEQYLRGVYDIVEWCEPNYICKRR